ncbi:hypothetical protein [Rhodococcus phage RGL3]|uniref:Uncharacterized protein n=1 Tax=Rhodococcus phage RGL3 TaxID=2922221 RepID=G9FHP7_9CAUD|nr:hypothetical protein RoPhRGL3_gp55 [Rhodococcus phage RGL3]AEV52135.1 hypothetical protein [Rhodococcus phage RGL3]
MALTERAVEAIIRANKELRQADATLTKAFEDATETGSYADADELAADVRHDLSGEFETLVSVLFEEFPELAAALR